MAKPFRSPLVGYNHNLSHLGRVFHVQTEDSGPAMPRLFTHLFFEGTILVSRKHEYDATLADDKVRVLMRNQHKDVIKDLMMARLDERIVAFFATRGQAPVPAAAGAAPGLGRETHQNTAPGAVPSAPLMATPGPVVVTSEVSEDDYTIPVETSATDASAPVGLQAGSSTGLDAGLDDGVGDMPADEIEDEADVPDARRAPAAADGAEASGEGRSDRPAGRQTEIWTAPVPPPPTHRRRSTRPLESLSQRGPAPAQVPIQPPLVVRSPDGDRPAFVRSDPAAGASKVAAGDGVVVQRSVVVGKSASTRAPRIRPPVPYVVTGGGHTQRPPQAAPDAPLPSATGAASPAQSSPAASSASGPGRPAAGFGVGRTDDKSLDEVILEYLSEDVDS